MLPLLSHLMVIGIMVVLLIPILVFGIIGIVIRTMCLFLFMQCSHVRPIRNGTMWFLDVIPLKKKYRRVRLRVICFLGVYK